MNSELHLQVGVSAGSVYGEKNRTPVVTLHFVKDKSALEDLDNEIFEPDDGRWYGFTMTVKTARQMIMDLEEAIDIAINEGELPEGIDPDRWEK